MSERPWSLRFLPDAERQLAALDRAVAERIAKRLRWLTQQAIDLPARPLRPDLAGLYKLRVGDWRVLYRPVVAERILIVVRMGHRSEVYGR